MDGDRKYAQRGYQDSERNGPKVFRNNGEHKSGDHKPSGPRPSSDITGPRLPRLVQAVTATRCFNCATQIVATTDLEAVCPKCGLKLHCCKQCAHFEPSTRFQCTKPIPARIPLKDKQNDCPLFMPRVTVARDAVTQVPKVPVPDVNSVAPRTASDARSAFESLFKK